MSQLCPVKKCRSELSFSTYLENKMFCHSCRNWYESDDKRFVVKEAEQVTVCARVEATAAKRPDPCPYHPKYKGKRFPVNDCSICWELYQFNSKQASVL